MYCVRYLFITCLMNSYQNKRKTTCWIWKMLFSVCSDNISCRHVIKTQRKQHIAFGTYCFPYVCFITCLHDMLSEHKENNTLKTQRLRNQCNNNVLYGDVIRTNEKQYISITKCPKAMKSYYFNLPGYLRPTFWPPSFKKKWWWFYFFLLRGRGGQKVGRR